MCTSNAHDLLFSKHKSGLDMSPHDKCTCKCTMHVTYDNSKRYYTVTTFNRKPRKPSDNGIVSRYHDITVCHVVENKVSENYQHFHPGTTHFQQGCLLAVEKLLTWTSWLWSLRF